MIWRQYKRKHETKVNKRVMSQLSLSNSIYLGALGGVVVKALRY
jgi:hypothetical protein